MSLTAAQQQRVDEARTNCSRRLREEMATAAWEVERGVDPMDAIARAIQRLSDNMTFLAGINGAALIAEGKREEAERMTDKYTHGGRR